MTLLFFVFISFFKAEKEDIQTPKVYPLSISTRMMNIIGNPICDQVTSDSYRYNFDDPSDYDQLCWSNNGNATFSYTFKGVQFLIYGKQRQFGKFNLLLDDEDLGEIIENSSNKNVTDLLYTSRVYKYGYHTIRAIGQKDQYFEIFKFAFWPEFEVKRLNISGIYNAARCANKPNETCEINDNIGTVTYEIKTSKIWIYGTIDPTYGILHIKLNNNIYLIETNGPHEDCKLLFESEKMNFTYNILSFIPEQKQSVSLCCIYYLNDQYNHADFNSQISPENEILVSLLTPSIYENISYIHLILIRLALSIVLLSVFVINIKKKFQQENTFIIVILGDSATKLFNSKNENNVKKYGNYCFSSYALLIKRLAIKYLGIKKEHILIFGKGEIGDYNITPIIPKKRIFVQLTVDEIYETKPLDFEFDFMPFQYTENILYLINSFFQSSHCKEPNIILYMYDHGDEKSFGDLKFLELYLGLLEIPHSSLHIYNESCKSKSMIIKIRNYFAITQVVNSFTPKITQDELFYIVSIAFHMYDRGNYVQLDAMISLDNRYFNFLSTEAGYDSFRHILSYLHDEISKDQLYNKFISEFSKKDTDLLVLFVDYYEKQYSIPYKYDVIHSIFEKGIRVIQEILRKFGITNAELWKIINDLKINKPNFAEKLYKMHPNHFIITSSHENGFSPTFGTMRINENRKFIAGSPAMSAYIIESLMNRSIGENSVGDIEKRVYGNYNGLIMEYATQSIRFATKKWIRLNINYWKTFSNSKTKILLKQNIKMNTSIKDIMESVGFRLTMKCNIQFDEKNKCITQKIQPIFPSIKAPNVIGIRLADLNEEHDYSEGFNEDDGYYSDYSSEGNSCHLNILSNTEEDFPKEKTDNVKLSNNTPSFISYDKVLPQSYINEVIREVKMKKSISYPLRVILIFKHELNKLINDDKFIKKYESAKSNELILCEIENLLYDWIKHFCPTYVFEEELVKFIQYYCNFVSQYRIPKDDAHDIFYNYMNIADQVASQLSNNDKKAAYNVKRLKYDSQKDFENNERDNKNCKICW
ncbi:hypothetical protein M9Y10_027857 [Tritrichomonas musculus]|uniref:Uncharacterized protein n=1 Tax=Tritrichomonas musculus TaxID=1915356 RepID=A0ABR2H4C4_9EUKA